QLTARNGGPQPGAQKGGLLGAGQPADGRWANAEDLGGDGCGALARLRRAAQILDQRAHAFGGDLGRPPDANTARSCTRETRLDSLAVDGARWPSGALE